MLWFVFLLGSGVLVLAGVRLLDRSPAAAAALISVGAVVGAIAIFWTIVPLLLAIALVTLSVMHARRAAPR